MKPERMLSDPPPSFEAATTSRTWPDSVEVKTLTSSGMIAPASVPQVMTVESFHHKLPSPRPGIIRYDTAYVARTETIEVSQTRRVSGASKFILSAFSYWLLAIASLTK